MRRRGELSKAMIDRDWPHQVALTATLVVARFKEVHETCRRLSACPRTHAFRGDDIDYVVYCFARPKEAGEFQGQFGGELIRPQDRPRGISRR